MARQDFQFSLENVIILESFKIFDDLKNILVMMNKVRHICATPNLPEIDIIVTNALI